MSSKPPDTPSSDAPDDTLPDTPDDAPEALPDTASITAPDAGPDSAATAKHHDSLCKSLFSDPVQAAAQLLLSSRFVLDDLRITADADIDARPLAPQARLGLVLMKHYRDRNLAIFIAAHADDVRRLHATEAGRLWLYRLLSYTWHVNRYTDRDSLVRHLIPLVGPEIEHTMLTYGQRLEQQGVEKGVEKGIEKGQRTALLRQLTRRFGALPEPVAAQVAAATSADIERWLDRILDATALDDVFV
jgi:hypothetical protein